MNIEVEDVKGQIITLCGSTKFKKEFERVHHQLEAAGNIVISLGCFHHFEKKNIDKRLKIKLDALHLKKITMSDAIFVINPKGYVGESTAREIEFAEAIGVDVLWLVEPNKNGWKAMLH